MTPQQKQLLEILDDGAWHCAFEFREKLFIVDYRKRLSELRQPPYKYKFETQNCKGECGRKHNAVPKLWKWVKEEQKEYWWEQPEYKRQISVLSNTLF